MTDSGDVLLPCLNEVAALPWALSRIPAGYRPIVADNGSDASGDIAATHSALVVAVARDGLGASAHAGLEAATASVVCFLDADGSLDSAEFPRVVDPAGPEPAELVLGRRRPTTR